MTGHRCNDDGNGGGIHVAACPRGTSRKVPETI
jgi:hypothetical protein